MTYGTQQPRFAFLTYDFGEYSIRHANGLVNHGEVMLAVPSGLAEPHVGILDPRVDFRPFDKPRLRQPGRQLKTVRWLLRQIDDFRPDVIHLQMGHLWFNLALPLLRRYPLVITIHDPRQHLGDRGAHNTPQAIMDMAYRRADEVIVHGGQLEEIVTSELGIDRGRVHVIPHIAIGARSTDEMAQEEDHLVLFFGRIWEYKGLEYLIEAQPLINAAVPDARIMIAGQGDDFERYERLMADRDRFIVHNRWISDDERTTMFCRASVVVLPYVEATQSGVVPVAYTYGKPVVATTTGGLPDIVEHERTGLLVAPRDTNALADAVIRLLSDRDLRHRLGEAGKAKLDRECSEEVVAARTVEVYHLAMSRRV